MVEEKVPPRTIKVVDRRRFTTEGDPRDDTPSDPETAPPGRPAATPVADGSAGASASHPATKAGGNEADQPGPAKKDPGAAAVTSPEFIELIATLAQQAEMLIVGTEGLPAEPDHARRIIDYLAALESKTAGNLSSEEHQVLSSVVFQLRSLFLQRKK